MKSRDLDVLIHRWTQDAIVAGQLEVFDDLLADDVIDRTGPTPTRGRAPFKERTRGIRSAFNALSIIVDDVVLDGGRAAWRWTLEGTHAGVFAGLAPTMARAAVRGVNFQIIAGGRVVEHWSLVDVFGTLQSLRASASLANR